ncbi:cyclic peptide export ABC transporter [Chitinophaga sp. Ak27]|uniref:cyclic peptide export ABC transporter n=1 Tax=Chitinophaga sp. Ak27 TaxID=2726116 RepID=UPI00145CAE63|nr:cyclic peptide export ABC transporter [Chitinophaga sp. Ak27]NLU93283.1 cyclic peptide export ABC transporter [Chitinophaga sp. Ak27]
MIVNNAGGRFFLLCCVLLSWLQVSAIHPGTIDSLVREQMKDGNIPGLTLVVIQDGRESIYTFGYTDVRTKEKVVPATLFELASCSKAFTALGILRLSKAGKINLQDPVSVYLPWLKFSYKGKPAVVTVAQLLHHTSGIPWYTISSIPPGNERDALEKTVRQLNNMSLQAIPGESFHYATVNYDILGLIIATVSGLSYETYVTDSVLSPLGMHHTFVGRDRVPGGYVMAQGHKISFFKARAYEPPLFKGNNPAGYIITDGPDMAQWLKVQMGLVHTELDSEIAASHLRDESVPPGSNLSYAQGWLVSLRGDGVIYHDGLNPDFTSYAGFITRKRTGVVILANSNSTYTRTLGNQLLSLMDKGVVPKDIYPESDNDRSFATIAIALFFYLFITLLFTGYIIVGIIRKRRKYRGWHKKESISMLLLFAAVLPCLVGIYLIPQAYMHFSWQAIRVWGPDSLQVMMTLLLLCIGLSCGNAVVSLLFPDPHKYLRVIPQTLIVSILSGIANMVLILLISSAAGNRDNLPFILFYFGLSVMIYLIGRSYIQRTLIGFTRKLVHEIRIDMVGKILSSSYEKFEKIENGRVLATINGDIYVIGNIAYMAISLATSIITVIGAFLYLSAIAFWATMVTAILVCVISTIYYFFSKSTRPLFEEARDAGNVLMDFMTDLINGYKEISLNRRKKLEFREDISDCSEGLRAKIMKAETNFIYAFLVGELLLILLLGTSAFGLPLLFPAIKFPVIMSFIMILLYLIGPINGILRSIPEIMQFKIAWDRIEVFLGELPSDLSIDEPMPLTVAGMPDSFQADGIRFLYDTGSAQPFGVGPVSFELNKGEILFITGGNGSGKSTLAKMLTGLYKPSAGVIRINNQVIPALELGEYFSVVFSPVHLFKKLYSVTIDGKEEEIFRYLEELDLSHKVSIRNMTFDTLELSNGQLKRLALLQCYLEDKPIYLFDEWAADQDPEYRKFFYRTLLPKMKMQNKIVIAITHDDHYFDVADKILKLNVGKMESLLVKGLSGTLTAVK